ncbi:MAG TPA: FmdE family protein [Rhizomicrobium sp.]|nr:FmdE family protein [Rhizomicrobium sp.]
MNPMDPMDATIVRIKDNGEVKELTYDGAMTHHTNTLWWGTAVGYRAMQAAAQALSKDGLWSRDDLYVVGAHPGPGVRDAIDYVTGVVGKDRYKVMLDDNCGMKCNSAMKFEWWVSDGRRTVSVRLRPDFVPRAFYELSDRLGTDEESEEDMRQFEISKVNLSTRIWSQPLERNFVVETIDRALAPGELPKDMQRADYWDDLATRKPAMA